MVCGFNYLNNLQNSLIRIKCVNGILHQGETASDCYYRKLVATPCKSILAKHIFSNIEANWIRIFTVIFFLGFPILQQI